MNQFATIRRLYRTPYFCRSILKHSYSNFDISSKRYISKPTHTSNQSILKFDPTNEQADFTTVGILPFLQKRLNTIFLSQKKNNAVSVASEKNASPTEDQRSLLSILNSHYSVILKGSAQSGKSLSLILYALNYSLSRVPNFGVLKKNPTVDSIILVPTDELLKKYRNYVKELTKDIPELCCPHEILKNSDNEEYSVTRRPIVIEIIYSDKSSEVIRSGLEKSKNPPHILITSPNILYDIMNDEKDKNYLIQKGCLNELGFFAVDDTEFHLSSTGFSNSNNFIRQGKKGKSISILENIIKRLQTTQIDYYVNELEKRLKSIEYIHKKNNTPTSKFNHAKFVFERDDLSVASISDVISNEFKNTGSEIKPDLILLKKLIKHKRKVLYKPIQYCFISTNVHHYAWEVHRLNSKSVSNVLQNPLRPNMKSRMLNEMFHQYLAEKQSKINTDILTRSIERMTRFDDTKRKFRKHERKLLSVGSFNLSNNKKITEKENFTIQKVNARFLEANNKSKSNIEIKDITFPHPSKLETIKLLENDIITSKYNLINSMKEYLKFRMKKFPQMKSPNKNMSMLIKATMENFRSEFPLDTSPCVIVVPPYINKKRVVRTLNKYKTLDKYKYFNSIDKIESLENFMPNEILKEVQQRTNLIIHPEQLVGQSIFNCQHFMIMGIDSLLDQLAFSSSHLNTPEIQKAISGIEIASSDLFYFYISKLMSSSNLDPKYFTFVMNNIDKWSDDIDYQRLGQILLYNEIWEGSEIINLSENPEDKKHISFGCTESYFNELKIENRKKL